MKKILAIFISLILILGVVLAGFLLYQRISQLQPKPTEPEVFPNRLYFSEFKDRNDFKKWQIIDAESASNSPSDWQIVNEKLVQKSTIFKNEPFYQGTNLIFENGNDWSDYQVLFEFKPPTTGGVGFLVRYQDENNFYRIYLTCDKELGGPKISVDKIQNGNLKNLYQIQKCFQPNIENKIKIIINNNRINLYLNSDKITIYGQDKENLISKGSFGFMVNKMANVEFDNLEILDLSKNVKSGEGEVLSEKAAETEEEKLDEEIEKILKEIGID